MMPINQKNFIDAAAILRQGGIIAFPTETVYGLGGDATNEEALKKIFIAKQRPIDHPLIVHIGNISDITQWAINISESAWILANTFWPGPLTLILKKAPGVSNLLTGGQDSIGLRIPSHPMALALLQYYGGGLAAPSANRFGRISPTTALAVQEELGNSVDLILDGGACEVGVESTIVDMSTDEPIILRPGMITAKQIADTLKKPMAVTKKNVPRVSGSLESHYAPRTKTVLIETHDLISFLHHLKEEEPIALITREPVKNHNKNIYCVTLTNNPWHYAQALYQTLRTLDKQGFQKIVIEAVPNEIEWDAIRDRLMRAAFDKKDF